jgi:hypothetical protein
MATSRATRLKTATRVFIAALSLVLLTLATYPVWKPAAKRFKWFVVATNMYQDVIRRSHLSTDQIGNPYTAIPEESELPDYLKRVDRQYSDYLDRLGLSPADLQGKTVLEVGPGNNVGVALRFVAAGAQRVIALDKFVPFQTSTFHQKLYRQIAAGLPPEEQQRIDAAVDLDNGVTLKSGPLSYVYGVGIEDAPRVIDRHSVDIIVSSAVMEEIYRADDAWNALDQIWRPGGYQMHAIDLRDYGMFTKHGFHPLEFLTLPETVYRYMTESVGGPNRRMVDYYRSKMAALGYNATIYTTWVLGSSQALSPPQVTPQLDDNERSRARALLQEIRPRLLEQYRNLPDDDLMVQGILLVARRPQVASTAAER